MKALDHVCVSHSKVNQYYLSMQNYSSKLGFPIKWYYLRWWLINWQNISFTLKLLSENDGMGGVVNLDLDPIPAFLITS